MSFLISLFFVLLPPSFFLLPQWVVSFVSTCMWVQSPHLYSTPWMSDTASGRGGRGRQEGGQDTAKPQPQQQQQQQQRRLVNRAGSSPLVKPTQMLTRKRKGHPRRTYLRTRLPPPLARSFSAHPHSTGPAEALLHLHRYSPPRTPLPPPLLPPLPSLPLLPLPLHLHPRPPPPVLFSQSTSAMAPSTLGEASL